MRDQNFKEIPLTIEIISKANYFRVGDTVEFIVTNLFEGTVEYSIGLKQNCNEPKSWSLAYRDINLPYGSHFQENHELESDSSNLHFFVVKDDAFVERLIAEKRDNCSLRPSISIWRIGAITNGSEPLETTYGKIFDVSTEGSVYLGK